MACLVRLRVLPLPMTGVAITAIIRTGPATIGNLLSHTRRNRFTTASLSSMHPPRFITSTMTVVGAIADGNANASIRSPTAIVTAAAIGAVEKSQGTFRSPCARRREQGERGLFSGYCRGCLTQPSNDIYRQRDDHDVEEKCDDAM